MNAWNLVEVLECNEFADLEETLVFFRSLSEFYPDFDRLLRERVTTAFPTDGAEDPDTEK